MGKIEQKIAGRARRAKIQQKLAVLLFRLNARSFALASAPEAVLLKRLFPAEARGSATHRMRQALYRLKSKGFLTRERSERGWRVSLTDVGEKFAEKLDATDRIKIKTPRTWDEKWRIVIFDIWERRRGMRDKLRRMLEKAGFKKVQDSVWVCPYDCEEFITFLRADLRLGKGILYIIAEGIEDDGRLRRLFNL
ncbi:CRISPR-associated endonuclease Cas2 [Candidatus Adlerbacteria bacterium RIFCSPHIGHO2_01_FULL_54_23]|uniref:CRISPR-associated endonuclease Cas2 n=2 Tax=Candidatus Adleribacteriota TaxID=1752736 RepID=A0A1F4Y074_9BACT|nr:MAG: Repressor in ring oxydation complex/ phenylacetic acid degradation pathway related protein (PaaX) [Candidatus Adlerbacteria bacterium GW2011_GWB1_54_7]OGC79257.1 MAG: CRISPR-associated endonuclease Cas2 [Candidatus Adlerbacteria bacterium RIFCSPHIGHO2_01_FULL_54_23]OGC87367.1 MAG: CRISPR-associated endonuclease Cas2 [Candidatus Adlerbacteria bacterium RIFCSPLOWO2_01_FULL_54_16]